MKHRKTMNEDAKKLTLVVIFMSMFVLVLYGLGPSI